MDTFTRVHLESKTDERTCFGLGPWRQCLLVAYRGFFRMHDWATLRPADGNVAWRAADVSIWWASFRLVFVDF